MNTNALNVFTDVFTNVIVYNNTNMPCYTTNVTAADGNACLECDIFNYYNYVWWFAYFNYLFTLDRNPTDYTHLRLKVKAVQGYGLIKLAASGGSPIAALVHNPSYSPDGLSIDDQKWRTIYIPLEDLGIFDQELNGSSILSDDVKPVKFYVDSIAYVKATATVTPFTAFPIPPTFSTARTSSYVNFDPDNTAQATVIDNKAATTILFSTIALLLFQLIM